MLQQLSRTNVQVSKLCEAHVHKTSTHITSIFCAVVAVPRLDYIAQEAQRRTCNTVCENDQFCQSSVQWMNCTEDCAVSEPHGRLCSEWTARKIVQWVNCTEDCAVNEFHGRLYSEWIPRKTVQWVNSTEDCATMNSKAAELFIASGQQNRRRSSAIFHSTVASTKTNAVSGHFAN